MAMNSGGAGGVRNAGSGLGASALGASGLVASGFGSAVESPCEARTMAPHSLFLCRMALEPLPLPVTRGFNDGVVRPQSGFPKVATWCLSIPTFRAGRIRFVRQ